MYLFGFLQQSDRTLLQLYSQSFRLSIIVTHIIGILAPQLLRLGAQIREALTLDHCPPGIAINTYSALHYPADSPYDFYTQLRTRAM